MATKRQTEDEPEFSISGKSMKLQGIAPAVSLVNPKFPHNVGKAVRAASCFGIKQVWFSGDRVSLNRRTGCNCELRHTYRK